MKKVGIVTIIDLNNYGNRLQNYAVQNIIEALGCEANTIKNLDKSNVSNTKIKNIFLITKRKIKLTYDNLKRYKRYRRFYEFDKKINTTKNMLTMNNAQKKFVDQYDYFMVGSDQVWNPKFKRLSDVDLLAFAPKEKRISFSASFGINQLPSEYVEKSKEQLANFKAISVREDAGKQIVEKLTGRRDVEVLVDPTMLVPTEEWDKVAKKPKQLKSEKYILNYFLGDLSESKRKEIERIACENDCEIISILDKSSPFYQTGPSEFLYLEKNAFLVCTDSFHSSVFAILYNRPFIVFEREDKTVNMNSRIETLINKLKLENRKFTGKITEQNLNHNYTEAYKILENEKEKSIKFLKRALEI